MATDKLRRKRWRYVQGGMAGNHYLAEETQKLVEAAYAAGDTTAQVSFRAWTYNVDFSAMTQTNTQTGKTRGLRRIE